VNGVGSLMSFGNNVMYMYRGRQIASDGNTHHDKTKHNAD